MSPKADRVRSASIGVVAVAALALAGCGAPGGPGGGGSTTTTTAPDAPTTTTGPTTTTTTTAPSPPTTEVDPTTTTTAPAPPVDTIVPVSHGNRESFGQAISGDGRYVVFASWATDLVPEDTSTDPDVFLWDRSTGTTTLVSEGRSGVHPDISGDGRFVVYMIPEPDDMPGDLGLWDATTGETTVLTEGPTMEAMPAISADGRFVTFESGDSNLDPTDTNRQTDVFVWDTVSGTTTRITNGDGASEWPAISADGRVVAYHSYASNLVPGDANGVADVFVWDAATGATTRITDGDRYSAYPKVSGDSRYVTYSSSATNLTPGDTDETVDVFRWEAATGTTTRITNGDAQSWTPDISDDGRYIAYHAYELVDDSNGFYDLYLWDATTSVSQRLTQGDGQSFDPEMSADGTAIAFLSPATDLVDGGTDTNGVRDVFLWTRTG